MTSAAIGRRDLVTAAAAGGLAWSAGSSGAFAAHPEPLSDVPATGVLGLWTRFDCDGGATFRLAQLDGAMRPVRDIAQASLGAERVRSVKAADLAARIFATGVVARSWGVAASDCAVSGNSVSHPGSGRCVGFVSWIDIV